LILYKLIITIQCDKNRIVTSPLQNVYNIHVNRLNKHKHLPIYNMYIIQVSAHETRPTAAGVAHSGINNIWCGNVCYFPTSLQSIPFLKTIVCCTGVKIDNDFLCKHVIYVWFTNITIFIGTIIIICIYSINAKTSPNISWQWSGYNNDNNDDNKNPERFHSVGGRKVLFRERVFSRGCGGRGYSSARWMAYSKVYH